MNSSVLRRSSVFLQRAIKLVIRSSRGCILRASICRVRKGRGRAQPPLAAVLVGARPTRKSTCGPWALDARQQLGPTISSGHPEQAAR